MSLADIFASVVLAILAESAVAIFFIAGSPKSEVILGRQAVQVAGWVTLICSFVLWIRRPLLALSGRSADRVAMSRFGRKADMPNWRMECPLMTQSGRE